MKPSPLLGKIISTQFVNRGTNDDGTPRTVTEAIIEDATGKKKVIIWSQVDLTVNNDYTIKRCSYNERFNNLSVNSVNDIIDMGVSKENPQHVVRKIENTLKISEINSGNGKWVKATVVSYSEALSSTGNLYKRVTLRDETGSVLLYDWGNNDYSPNETITVKIEVKERNGRTFINVAKDSKIGRE